MRLRDSSPKFFANSIGHMSGKVWYPKTAQAAAYEAAACNQNRSFFEIQTVLLKRRLQLRQQLEQIAD